MRSTITALALSALAFPGLAAAADTTQAPCRTTEECNALAARIGAAVPAPSSKGNATSPVDQAQDQFHWVNRINKASVVMLTEEGIIPPETGASIARGVAHVIDQAKKPEGKRPADVMQVEKIITDLVGPEASLIHTGRSRQDMYATYRMAKLRNQTLDYSDALNSLRQRLLAVAGTNVGTLVPAYTNGVQAQPISYAHYLLAYEASFARDAQRIRELYARMNRSAMGTAVLANSSWPLNRERLAELLGFDGIIENSLDSSQVAPSDVALEATGIASSGAIRLGAMLGDIHTQYHQIRPWLLLEEGSTYTSSSMPQKRNPGLVMRAREAASNVVGLGHTVAIRAHNVTTGMTDYKEPAAQLGYFPQAVRMIEAMNRVVDALRINRERALEELDGEWTASMELAEALQMEHKVPFRVGHGFASAIVTEARTTGLRPREFPFAKARELYAEAAGKYKLADTTLPMNEARFREVLSAEYMVKSRVGTGGPQPAEVERMLAKARAAFAADTAWMAATRRKLDDADARLDATFAKLLPK